MTLKITIKDYPCGYGKTTKMIKSLSSNEKYLIVLPTLDEITRVINGSKHVKLLTPELGLDGATTKKEALQTLVLAGESIAITHALFSSLKGVAKEGLLSDYNIIIDEVPEVVKPSNYRSRESIQEFYIDTGYITVDNDGLITPNDKWCSKNKQVSDTLSENIRIQAKKGHLFLAGGSTFLSVLPEILLTSGKSVCILSYKTSGSYLLPYLKKLSIPYLVESDIEAEKKFLNNAATLITVKDIPSLSGIKLTYGAQKEGMSVPSYYSKIPTALKNMRSRHLSGVPIENILITCKKDCWEEGKGRSGVFAKNSRLKKANWIANTTRGTNNFDHCSHLIYLYDQNVNPSIVNWLGCNTSAFNDAYALTELIQWVWRGGVRKGQPVTLYIPSQRMRTLFCAWLNGECIADRTSPLAA